MGMFAWCGRHRRGCFGEDGYRLKHIYDRAMNERSFAGLPPWYASVQYGNVASEVCSLKVPLVDTRGYFLQLRETRQNVFPTMINIDNSGKLLGVGMLAGTARFRLFVLQTT